MEYIITYLSTDKMTCVVDAESEEEARYKFENDTGECDYHEYSIDISREFLSVEPNE